MQTNTGYLIFVAVICATMFCRLPEWSTFLLLFSMSFYDLAAVLLPLGPLKLLVELARERGDELPALVYEARPVRTSIRQVSDINVMRPALVYEARPVRTSIRQVSDINVTLRMHKSYINLNPSRCRPFL
jgi:presenilin 1